MPNAALKAADAAYARSHGPAGLELVQAFEACMMRQAPGRFTTYRDSAGILTIGWGHTNHHLPRFREGAAWSQAECDSALASDMASFQRHVHEAMAQHEFDALVSWPFNTGGPASAALWKKLSAGDKWRCRPSLRTGPGPAARCWRG